MKRPARLATTTAVTVLVVAAVYSAVIIRGQTPGELSPDSKGQPAEAAQAIPPAGPTTQSSTADDRLAFLMVQLSSVEASINAVNNALRGAGYKVAIVTDKADTYAKGNELMDRNGGGPVAWRNFYGSTARQFAPRDIFGDRQNLQRPAQFDYVYRANNDQIAKANEEIATLGKRVDALLARRKKLESEQSALWATITFESIANQEYALQRLYRLQLQVKPSAATDPSVAAARLEAMRVAVLVLRIADHTVAAVMETVNTDQQFAYKTLCETVQKSHDKFQDAALDFTDASGIDPADARAMKELLVLSKKLTIDSKNMCDAYKLALDGDAAGEEERKQTFRGQLQRSQLGFAETTQELDQSLTKLAGQWNIEGKTGTQAPDTLPQITTIRTTSSESNVDAPKDDPPVAAPASIGAALDIERLRPGLTAEVFNGDGFSNLVKNRVDAQVDFVWPDHAHPEPGMSGRAYSIRWTGVLMVPPGGVSGIGVIADDGCRLTVDGKLLLSWRKPQNEIAPGPFAIGPHQIQFDYWNRLAGGHAVLQWVLAADPRNPRPVPASALFHLPTSGTVP